MKSSPYRDCAYLSIFFISIFLIASVSAVGTYPALDPSMVLYYHFNNQSAYGENDTMVYDFSGNGNNGTANNTLFQAGTGILGDGSFSFNGKNSTLTTINNVTFNDFSISFWLNVSLTGQNQKDIINFRDGGNKLLIRTNSSDYLNILYNSTTSTFAAIQETNYTIGKWEYFVLTKTGSTLWVYKNGVGVRTYGNIGNMGSGKITFSNNPYFNGSLDEVLIYNRSLSSSEISNIYYEYTHSNCTTIVFYGCSLRSSIVLNGSVYHLNDSIHLSSNNVYLNGNGSILYYNENNVNHSFIDGLNINNFTVYNLTLIKNPLPYSTQNDYMFYFEKSGNLSFLNLNLTSNYNHQSELLYLKNVTNSLFKDSSVFLGYNRSSSNSIGYYAIYSNNISSMNNNFYVNGNFSYGIYYGYYTNNSFVLNNFINLTGGDGYGVHFEDWSGNSLVNNNIIHVKAQTDLYSSSVQSPVVGIYFENSAQNNTAYNNTVYVYSNNSNGITVDSGSDYGKFINNSVFVYASNTAGLSMVWANSTTWGNGSKYTLVSGNNIYIYDELSTGILTHRPQCSNNTIILNNIFAYKGRGILIWSDSNNISNNYIYTNSSSNVGLELGRTASSNFILNNVFNSSNFDILFNYLNGSNYYDGPQNSFNYFNGLLKINNSGSYITNISFLNNQSLLIYYNNFSALVCGNNCNFTLLPNQSAYVYYNYFLSEGDTTFPQNPIWFSSSTTTSKTITSNLTNAMNVTVITQFPITCNQMKTLSYFSGNSTVNSTYSWSGQNAVNECNTLLTAGDIFSIAGVGGSNYLSADFTSTPKYTQNQICSVITNGYSGFFSGLQSLFGILAIAIIIGLLFIMFIAVNQNGSINYGAADGIFDEFPIGLIMVGILSLALSAFLAITLFGVLCSV